MKKWLLALALCLFSTAASAQCSGVTATGNVCGNLSGVTNVAAFYPLPVITSAQLDAICSTNNNFIVRSAGVWQCSTNLTYNVSTGTLVVSSIFNIGTVPIAYAAVPFAIHFGVDTNLAIYNSSGTTVNIQSSSDAGVAEPLVLTATSVTINAANGLISNGPITTGVANATNAVVDSGTSWATFRAAGGGDANGAYFFQNGSVGKLFSTVPVLWAGLINNESTNGGTAIGSNGAGHIWDYPSGGVYIGASPSDPGANNVKVQGSVTTNITGGGNQCVQASNTGALSGTGAPCSMTLLATLTASNSASLSDTTHITGTYTSYKLIFQNIIPATNEKILELQIHSGGAFKATGYLWTQGLFEGTTTISTNSAAGTFIPLSYATDASGNALANTAPGMSGEITIINPSVSGLISVSGQFNYLAGVANGVTVGQTYGYWNTAGVVDGFQVLMDSGNITSGSILIYGIP